MISNTNRVQSSQNSDKDTVTETSTRKYRKLTEKKFELRNSLLTDILERNLHFAASIHVFLATMMCFFTSLILNDYFQTGEITLGIYLIRKGFGKMHITAATWICYMLVTLLVFYIFQFWATVRIQLLPNGTTMKIWDRSWMVLTFMFYVFNFRISSLIVNNFNFPIASAAIVLVEQTRLTMKIHSFVRYNAEKIIKYKPHSDISIQWPEFNKYLYFLFAPTLVYRDKYPRTTKINWDFVITRAVEAIGVILFQTFLFHKFILSPYENFGLRKYTWTEIIVPAIAGNSVPGLLIMISGFYLLLHSVQNLFAELLRFGDRQFYREWWSSTSLADFFRNWNVIVHDWLHTYIYRDICELTGGSKSAGKLVVFLASVVVHEWALSYLFGFFYPVLTMFFMVAAILSLIRFPTVGFINVMFWYCLASGSGFICSMYTLEYYARVNKPVADMDSLKYYFIPVWTACDCII